MPLVPVKMFNSMIYKNSVEFRGVQLWNKLPEICRIEYGHPVSTSKTKKIITLA